MISTAKRIIFKIARTAFVLAFWILVWHFVAEKIDLDVILSNPFDVAKRLIELGREETFYQKIFNSVLNVLAGFFQAVAIGTVSGIITAKIKFLDELISPLLSVIKATPVASFILLAYFLIETTTIPSFISLLMVLPIIHGNVSEGLKNTPPELIEMTKMYKFSAYYKITKLYLPSVLPYFLAGFKTSLGLAWKAGVAAEVICNIENTVGRELYSAKTYLETIDIFAWTVTIIIISVIIEKTLVLLVNAVTPKKRNEVAK